MIKKALSICIFFLYWSSPLSAQDKAESTIAANVESLRKAMVDPDKAILERLVSSKLSYGHSNGKVEGKESFVQSLTSGASDFVSIDLSGQEIVMSGNTAIVRHILQGNTNDAGKAGTVKLAVLLVWNRAGSQWQLLARQAVKLTQ
jgi:hypothetical protein